MTETTKKKRKSLALHWKILLFVLASVLGTAFIGLFHDGKPNSTKPEQTSNFYVNDYAHVFSSQTESFIKEQGTLLKERTGVEVVVASVPNTGYEELEEYSIDMAHKWGSGYFDEANGVLILYTIDQPHARIQFGYGLEKWLSNEKCKQILNDFTVNAITNQQWNKAAIETWINLVREVYTKYGTDIPKELMVIPEIVEEANTMTDADAELPPQ